MKLGQQIRKRSGAEEALRFTIRNIINHPTVSEDNKETLRQVLKQLDKPRPVPNSLKYVDDIPRSAPRAEEKECYLCGNKFIKTSWQDSCPECWDKIEKEVRAYPNRFNNKDYF